MFLLGGSESKEKEVTLFLAPTYPYSSPSRCLDYVPERVRSREMTPGFVSGGPKQLLEPGR